MNICDLLYLGGFLLVWYLLMAKVLPRFGVRTWMYQTCKLPEGDKKTALKDNIRHD